MARSWIRVAFVLAVAMGVAGSVAAEPDRQGIAFFERSIRPVLVNECYQCHSTKAEKIQGGLVLDNEAGLLTGGESGPAVVPGNPAKSLLIQALKHEDLEMPPKKKLSDEVIADFVKWVRMGAPYPHDADAAGAWMANREASQEEARKYWSFQPIQDPDVPRIRNTSWPFSDLDRFVAAAHEEAGLHPVADADARTLVRRLYFDLIGLPPTPDQVQAFEQAAAVDRAAATRKLVDELLASPHFGEHWGRHWLDVARFAESNGNVDNELFPEAWRYRNWVIDAFNQDLPWDQFVTQQLAGDLLPYDTPQQRNQQLIATGFLALTSKPRPQGNPNYLLDLVAEQIDTATIAFMGLTVGCARCHDHKFDPIPTAEYYQMAAIFENTEMLHGASGRQGNNTNKAASGELLQLVSTDPAQAAAFRKYEQERRDLETRIGKLRSQITAITGTGNDKKAAKNKPDGAAAKRAAKNLSAEQRTRLANLRSQMQEAQARLEALQKNAPRPAGECMGVRDRDRIVEGRIRIRGEAANPGDPVPRGFVSVGYVGDPPPMPSSQSGRLQLAQWMVSPRNTLTARVAVNRIWRHLFGEGIVKSVDNFGHLGELPSNQALLDHLAVQFMRDGWSVKSMIRTIVLSRTYQLASDHDAQNFEKDPDNRLIWRHDVRRLDAEPLRDALLAVSGLLDPTPPTTSMVAERGKILVQNGNQKDFVEYDDRHRSVYLPIVRSAVPEMLHVFDMPDPELVVGDRSVTNVPAQSLFFMNSPFIVECAQALAKRIGASEARIETLFQWAYGRSPATDERTRIEAYLSQATDREQAWVEVCQAVLASAEFRYVE